MKARTNGKSGQALVEFLVGIIAVLVLFAGLLQLSSLNKTHTDTMVAARREAGERAMLNLGNQMDILTNPDYILDWEEGPDTSRHSHDDVSTSADPSLFQNEIMDNAVADPAHWNILDQLPGNDLSALRNSLTPSAEFGLVRGHDEETIALLPAVQHLLYSASSINVETEVWMTWTQGMY